METLEHLESDGLIQRDDVSSLLDALNLIGRVDLQKKVTAFEKEYKAAEEDTVKRPRSNYDDFNYPFSQGINFLNRFILILFLNLKNVFI